MYREQLRRLADSGRVLRVARGLYALPEHGRTDHHSLALAAKLVPHGVVCLLSALSFHGLTGGTPEQVWLAIDFKARKPKVDTPRLRVVRFSGEALSEGVEEHQVEGVPVRVYSPAKTVADCFKYRNKIGLEVAVEALKEGWMTGRISAEELNHYAVVCRMSRVRQPYIEMLTL